eukprot:Partr_v1_DN27474_c0_g1_i1_m72280 putative N(Alpha)-acetyltransferase 35, NatC auxiliary
MDEEMLNALEIRDDTPAEWTDITSQVQALASSLAIGELLHTPDFSLFHALAAVEIMDPKMDSGMLSGGDPVKYRDISAVLSRDDLDTSQLQAIGIQYLRCLATWLSGKTLAQTVFMSLFTHDIPSIADPTVDVLTRLVMSIVTLVCDTVTFTNVAYEEDIVRDMHGLSYVRDDKLLATKLSHVLETCSDTAVKSTLLFLRDLNLLLTRGYESELEAPFVGKICDRLLKCLSGLSSCSESGDSAFGFDPMASRRLSTQVPLVKLDIMAFSDAVVLFQSIIDDLSLASAQTPAFTSTMHLMDFLVKFSVRRPNILSRALIGQWSFQSARLFETANMSQFIMDSVKISTAYAPPSKASRELSEVLAHFQHFATETIKETIHTCCLNLGRVRRKLLKLLQSWDALQAESEGIDAHIQSTMASNDDSYNLANWVYTHKLLLAEHCYLLGFDLDLYASDEYASIYGYCDFIYNNQLINIRRCRALVSRASNLPLACGYRETHIMAKQEICRGILRFLAVLKKLGVQVPSTIHRQKYEETRYNHRFKYMRNLGSPQELSYDVYKNSSDPGSYDEFVLFDNALKSFESGKYLAGVLANSPVESYAVDYVGVDTSTSPSQLMKVCFANMVS